VKKQEFRELAAERPILMDGSTGYLLMKRGMPDGVCPEAWTLEHPSIIKDIQSSYVVSGSDIILAPTFGANRLKLNEYGLGSHVFELNSRLAALARDAVGSKLVAGDISMTGEYVRPIGDLEFEDAVDIFKEQIRGLVAGGVDLLFIETMTELNETRAALIAAKETCDLTRPARSSLCSHSAPMPSGATAPPGQRAWSTSSLRCCPMLMCPSLRSPMLVCPAYPARGGLNTLFLQKSSRVGAWSWFAWA